MKKSLKILLILFFAVSFAMQLHGTDTLLIINEIFYNPPSSSDDSLEFVEIYNAGTQAINMEGFRLKSPSASNTGVNVEFHNVTIGAGEYVVVAADSLSMQRNFNLETIPWKAGKTLNNTSKDIVLFNSDMKVIDSLTYYNTSPWPSVSSSGGYSIELLHPGIDNTVGENWAKSNQVEYIMSGADTIWTLYCSPGMPNLNHRPVVAFSNTNEVIPLGASVTFTNESLNYDSISWTFEGGTPTSSQQNNPAIVYDNYGAFDVTLFANNQYGNYTLKKEKLVKVFPTCATVDTLPYAATFVTMPSCWFSYPPSGDGSWQIIDNEGYNDSNSIAFDCASYTDNAKGTLYSGKFDITGFSTTSLSFYYHCPDNQTTVSKAPTITIEMYDSTFNILQTEIITATKTDDWTLFTTEINNAMKYFGITIESKANNGVTYIDDIILLNRPNNTVKITGLVASNGVGIADILVKFQPGSITATTASDGTFSAFLPSGWSGTVQPANPQYMYTPGYVEVIDAVSDIDHVDFAAAELPDGWVFSQTAQSHTFCIPKTAVDSTSLTPGSWIGVFYENAAGEQKCCGAMQWWNQATQCLNAWASDTAFGDAGFTEGGQIFWKTAILNNTQQLNAEVEYASGPQTFQIDGITFVQRLDIQKITQTVVIPSGWSGISSYVVPFEDLLDELTGTYSGNIIVMSNDSGNYIPGTNSEITHWDADKGWTIKTTSSIVIDFVGKFNPNTSVNFKAGWTLFPVKTNVNTSADSLFAGNTKLEMIKGYGTNEIYIPGLTNDLILKPGKSYKARFNDEYTLTFENKSQQNENYCNIDPLKNIYVDGESIMVTPVDHVILVTDKNLLDNDTLLIYSQSGICCGFGVASEGKILCRVYGDDITTTIIDGMIDEEKMNFTLLREGKKYTMEYNLDETSYNDEHFVQDGFTKIDFIDLIPTGMTTMKEDAFVVFPNPFDDRIYINNTNSGKIKISLANIVGNVVYEKYTSDKDIVLNVSKLERGIYLLRVTSKHATFTKTLIK